jgi:DUF1009 family protein
MQDNQHLFPIAIFAGRGQFPKILIDDCVKKNRQFTLFLLNQENYEIDYSSYNPHTISYGEVERFLDILRKNNTKNIVFIGGVTKPNFSSLKVDKKGTILLAKIIANKILGDDAVLRTVINFFEKEGLKFLRIDEILDCVFSSKSTVTKILPSQQNIIDIEIGIKAIKYFSKFDVGQSVVVTQKQIIAVEALEGTDEMIKRCKDLKIQYLENSVLIKMKKSFQTSKADLPSIGVDTIINCHQAKIAGIAIQANSTIVLNKQAVIDRADQLGLFLTVI